MAFIGTAGWNIPAPYAGRFPATGTHLQRYAARLSCAEINSSFYRPHQYKTYARWAAGVPHDFRFSVKLPRVITQTRQLQNYDEPLMRFLDEIAGLGAKLGVILVQLPPSLAYDRDTAAAFFRDLRARSPAALACEPRHPSWFTPTADAALRGLHVARVAADPPRAPKDGVPGGWTGFSYRRLHGSPKIYYSEYSPGALDDIADHLRKEASNAWCIFDNTAAYAALGNALDLRARLG
jgi:uncharacterized protein YecE (DUF72 family)